MAKTAHYFISGIWKDSKDNITHVLLHSVSDGDSFKHGVKTTELEAIHLIKNNHILYTITWSYPGWTLGAKLTYVSSGGYEYLRTIQNSTPKDNLDNSIDMSTIAI